MAFVATSAPSGWLLGRWSQTSQTTWQEEKLDSTIVHQFDLVSGPSVPGSATVRLRMKNQNTEVLLLDTTVQVFVNGSYFGEYGGQWEGAAGRRQAAPTQARAPSNQMVAAQRGPVSEQIQVPSQAAAFQSGLPDVSDRPPKAAGLDCSPQAVQRLCDAAKIGDLAKVKECLDARVDPDGFARDGRTPLMAAAGGGHVAAVQALLDAGADPTLGKGDETPMTIAFQKGNQDILKVLFNASFNFMNNLVGPKFVDIPQGDSSDNAIPENALDDYRGVTAQLARVTAKDKPTSPQGKQSLLATDQAKADKDEMMRMESVRMTMKTLTTRPI